MHTDETIPKIIIICGFLGSGKTTLLKKMLEWEQTQSIKPVVIMSEFGDIDIDGILVDDNYGKLTRITGGCACCDLRDELINALRAALQSNPERIYIEATGVADPAGILEAISPVTQTNSAFIGKVIVVYDASRHKYFGKDFALIIKQLTTADMIIVNKCDAVMIWAIDEIVEEIKELNPGAQVLTTINCAMDIEAVLKGTSTASYSHNAESTSGSFRSFAFVIEEPVSEVVLKKWLLSLPKSVVRVKGFVKLAERQGYFEVQATQGQCVISLFPGYDEEEGVLVVIAHPMRTDGLVHSLQRCIAR